MNAFKTIAAVATFAIAGSAFAANAPVSNAAATAAAANTAVAANASVGIAAATLNVPSVVISKSTTRSRAEVHAEAVQFVKNHKTALAVLLDHAK